MASTKYLSRIRADSGLGFQVEIGPRAFLRGCAHFGDRVVSEGWWVGLGLGAYGVSIKDPGLLGQALPLPPDEDVTKAASCLN